MNTENIAAKLGFIEKLKKTAGGMTEDYPKPVLTAFRVVSGNEETYSDVRAAYEWLDTFGKALERIGGTPDPLLYGILDDLKAAAEAA